MGHPGVAGGGYRAGVAEQSLNRAQVPPIFQQMGGNAMAQGVNVNMLADTAVQGDLLDGLLHPTPGHHPRETAGPDDGEWPNSAARP